MKSVTFSPLRWIGNGKIAVAHYMAWNRLRCLSAKDCVIIVRVDHNTMPPDAQVHNYKGEPLFFPAYEPDEHTAYPYPTGIDAEGTPVFSHYTADYIATHFTDLDQFEPLTVERVVKWWGWFVYRVAQVRFPQ